MSELNYINETVVPRTPKSINETVVSGMSKDVSETVVPGMPDGVSDTIIPRMPKSVSDEQLFVFVPIGSDFVAGIFKINTNDFDKNSLPVLTIKQDEAVTQNGTGFVRGGAVYSFVKTTGFDVQSQIDDLKTNKQNKTDNNLNTTHKNVVGAINEVKSTADSALAKANSNENYIKTVESIANSASNDASEAKAAATRAESNVIDLSKKVTNMTQQVDTNTGNIKQLRTDVNGLTTRVDTAEEDIGDLITKDGELEGRIGNLEQSAYGGETPIGTYPSAAALPTSEQLTAFVQQEVSRAPKLGDVVLFTQIVTGGTDKSYKFMYTATGWSNYVIPTVESATNTDKGILQGTLGDTTGNVQVSIVDGKVADILVKDGSTYKSIKVLLDVLRAALVKTFDNVQFTLVATDDNTITNFPCKYTAYIEGVNVGNVADVYFSAIQIPLEIFSSYAEVSKNKVSIFATTSVNYPKSVIVPTVKIS